MINLVPKNRKGTLIFVPTIVIFTFILVAYAAVLFEMQEPATKQTIGEVAASMINAYSDGESFLFYSDRAAEYSANDAVYELAENGGVKEGSGCIKKYGYMIWHKNCKPGKETAENAFIGYFEVFFNNYLNLAYANRKTIYDYDLESDGKFMVFKGLSKESFSVAVQEKLSGQTAKTGTVAFEDCKQDYGNVEAESKPYNAIIEKYAAEHKIELIVLKCMIKRESNFDRLAVSGCGAAGLMQLMPGTASDEGLRPLFNKILNVEGCDKGYANNLKNAVSGKTAEESRQIDARFDAEQNIKAGSSYFKKQLNRFNDIRLALAAYNVGHGNVIKYNNMIPPFLETQRYVGCIEKCIAENKAVQSKITGSAIDEEFAVVEETEQLGSYEANASFLVKFEHDFSDYDRIYETIDEKVKNGCLLDPPGEDISKCFSDELGMKWDVKDKKEDVVYIEVDTKKKIERFNKIDDNNVIIRLGVNLAEWEKQEEVSFNG